MRASNPKTLTAQTTSTPPTMHSPSALKDWVDIGIPILISLLVIWLAFTAGKQWLSTATKTKTDVLDLLIETFKNKTKDQAEAISLLAANLQTLSTNDATVLQLLTQMAKHLETSESTLHTVIITVGSTTQQLQTISDNVKALHRRLDEDAEYHRRSNDSQEEYKSHR